MPGKLESKDTLSQREAEKRVMLCMAGNANFVANLPRPPATGTLLAMELISIIIPTHNYGHLIGETLGSLLAQTYPAWECLIIDDGSSDDTEAVVGRYVTRDARFRYTYQASHGVSGARNVGLGQASGTYIQFLDADDLLLPRKLEVQVAYLQHYPHIDLVYSNVRYFSTTDPGKHYLAFDLTNTEWMPRVDDAPHSAIQHLLTRNIMPIQAPLVRASLLRRVGLFNAAMRYCEDWDYWFRCAVAGGQIRYLDDENAISLVRVHHISASQNSTAMLGGGQLMTEKFIDYLQQHPGIINPRQQVAIKRARAIDLIVARRFTTGLLLGISTMGQPTAGTANLRDVFYWFRRTLLAPVSPR